MGKAQSIATQRPLRIHGPSGEVIEAVPAAVDRDPTTLRLTVEVTPEDYATIASAALFHLTAAAGGSGADDFRPTRAVRIELRPDDGVLEALAGLGDDPTKFVIGLSDVDGDEASKLLATESWLAAAVSSEVDLPPGIEGTLREGLPHYLVRGSRHRPPRGVGDRCATHRPRRHAGATAQDAPGLEWTTVRAEGSWRSVALADDNGRLAIYGSLPTRVTADRYPEVALLLTHLNSGFIIGNWELAVGTGEICMKTSVDVGDEPLSPQLARRLIDDNAEATAANFVLVDRLAIAEITIADALTAADAPNG